MHSPGKRGGSVRATRCAAPARVRPAHYWGAVLAHLLHPFVPSQRERESTATALSYSWSLKTSGQWSPLNPARGQCNVTALLLNELFGGEILKTPLPEGDRFYIRVGGERVDLTDSQFAAAVIYLDIAPDRSEALAGTSVSEYEALRATFIEHFKSCE